MSCGACAVKAMQGVRRAQMRPDYNETKFGFADVAAAAPMSWGTIAVIALVAVGAIYFAKSDGHS